MIRCRIRVCHAALRSLAVEQLEKASVSEQAPQAATVGTVFVVHGAALASVIGCGLDCCRRCVAFEPYFFEPNARRFTAANTWALARDANHMVWTPAPFPWDRS